VSALQAGGCDAGGLALATGGEWEIYLTGAPPEVNAGFPSTLEPSTPFTARCDAIAAPALDIESVTITVDGFTFTLENGRDEQPIVPGAATVAVAQLAGRNAYGDLDGDGQTDAAFVLISDPGGSGTFYYVSALTADGAVLDPVLLGDRIRVRSIEIVAGELRVGYLTRNPDEPFAATPTVPAGRSFVRDVGALAPAGCAAQSPGGASSLVFVTSPPSGALFPSGSTVEGCSRTFESTVNWELYDRTGALLESGFTSGGGVDGRAPFSFFVTYTVDEEQVGRLEVFEVDVSGGEGFPPPRDVVPVVLTPGADVVQLLASTWRLATLAGAALRAGTEITADFDGGNVTGSAGCNSYSGSYTAAAGALSFPSPFAVTLMACDDAIMAQEQAYLGALAVATSFSIDGDALTVHTGEGELVLTAVTALTQNAWTLTSVAGSSLVSGTEITANFAAGVVTGSSGCNSYAGAYELSGSALSFPSPFAVTLRACEEEILDQEQAYLVALAAGTSFAVDGDVLTVQSEEGDLVFAAVSGS
jgi:heat shock protein HslJ